MQNNHISYLDAHIHYFMTGKGPCVVLIHGFAEDSSIWDQQVEFLKDKCLLIIPDLPGSGRSALINNKNPGIETYAECIKQILDQENITSCMLIGHSMGGYITLAFAEEYPSMLLGLGLFHSSAYADDTAKIEIRKKAIEFINKNGSETFLKTSIPGLFYNQGNSAHAETLIEKGKVFSKDALIQYYEAMIARPDRTKILKNIGIPVLFVIGAYDKAVPFEHSLQQSHMPEQSYIYILRSSAHMGMLEEPGRSNEILANFLQSQ